MAIRRRKSIVSIGGDTEEDEYGRKSPDYLDAEHKKLAELHGPKSKAARDAYRKVRMRRVTDNLLKSRGLLAIALRESHVSPKAHRDWMVRYPEYRENTLNAIELAKDLIEIKLIKKAEDGDVKAILAWLGARAKERGYGVSRQEQTGKDGEAIKVTNSPTIEDVMRSTTKQELDTAVDRVLNNRN